MTHMYAHVLRLTLETKVQGAQDIALMPPAITELKCSLANQTKSWSFVFILSLLDNMLALRSDVFFAAIVVISFHTSLFTFSSSSKF